MLIADNTVLYILKCIKRVDLMASVLTTIKKKLMFIYSYTTQSPPPKKTQLGKYSIYSANKCRKQKLTAKREQIYFLLFTP